MTLHGGKMLNAILIQKENTGNMEGNDSPPQSYNSQGQITGQFEYFLVDRLQANDGFDP